MELAMEVSHNEGTPCLIQLSDWDSPWNIHHPAIFWVPQFMEPPKPIGSMYAIYGNIYHQYTPNVSIYTIHGSYGKWIQMGNVPGVMWVFSGARAYYGATTRSCYMAMATWWGTTRCRRTRGSWDHVENEWEDKQQSWMIMDEFNIIIYIYIRLNKYDIYFIHFCFFL